MEMHRSQHRMFKRNNRAACFYAVTPAQMSNEHQAPASPLQHCNRRLHRVAPRNGRSLSIVKYYVQYGICRALEMIDRPALRASPAKKSALHSTVRCNAYHVCCRVMVKWINSTQPAKLAVTSIHGCYKENVLIVGCPSLGYFVSTYPRLEKEFRRI